MSDLHERLQLAASTIAERTGRDSHDLVVVLGSGLGEYAANHPTTTVPYADIPGFPTPTAPGHQGALHSLEIGHSGVLLLAGRSHAYEGNSMDEVTFPVRAAIRAGCTTVVLTNAAGAIDPSIERGQLVLLSDHINMAVLNPLTGVNDERIGPRFVDLTDAYSARLRTIAKDVGDDLGKDLAEGVYVWFPGPMFETPAEIQAYARLGGQMVGMSTVPEVIAARHMSAEVLCVSLCTNLAAGVSDSPITAEEVMASGRDAAPRFAAFLDRLLPRLLDAPST